MTALPPFQTVLDEHSGAVMAVLRGAVGRDGAEDCFQETFLAALRAYPQLDDARNLRGWLLTIAHRKAIDHHRAGGRRPVPVAEPGEIAVEDGIPARDERLWAAVDALPPKQRAAVALR
ncbi:MAG: RNA polymerase sigma factor, partial [Solirubrobacterales bacterium]